MSEGYESKRARAEGYANKLLAAEEAARAERGRWTLIVDAHMEGQRDAEQRLEADLAAAVEQRQAAEREAELASLRAHMLSRERHFAAELGRLAALEDKQTAEHARLEQELRVARETASALDAALNAALAAGAGEETK